jgi:dihydroneopterin aldolase
VIGTVRVRNLEFQANHGASADERRSTRRFQVDVDLTFPMTRALESDRLSDTINYADVCGMVVDLISE